jgi:hypothetical protein
MTTTTTSPKGNTMTTTSLTPVEIAKDARKAIRAAFPGLKFSLTNSSGTGYGWLHLSWTDGPTDQAMRDIVDTFDAMLGGYTHINSSRRYSVDAETFAAAEVAANPGRWDDNDYFATRRVLYNTTF